MKLIFKYLLFIGVLLIAVPFAIQSYYVMRIVAVLMGIFLITLSLTKYFKYNKIVLFILPLLLIICLYFIDYGLFFVTKRIPIFVNKIVSSEKVTTYNSWLYRVFNCNDTYIMDFDYQKVYQCSNGDLTSKDINDFLKTPVISYEENKNKFIKLKGKVTSVIGNSTIILEAYEGEVDINGYVKFDNNKEVRLTGLKINPNGYYIYDEIEVVGLVSDYQTDEKDSIILNSVKILDNGLYDNYEIIVNNQGLYEERMLDVGLYYLGIENIYYKYNANNIYELSYLIFDERESVDNLVIGIDPNIINNNDRLYKLNYYNILICSNENIYFINKNYYAYEKVC